MALHRFLALVYKFSTMVSPPIKTVQNLPALVELGFTQTSTFTEAKNRPFFGTLVLVALVLNTKISEKTES